MFVDLFLDLIPLICLSLNQCHITVSLDVLFKDWLGYLGLLHLHIYFRICLLISIKSLLVFNSDYLEICYRHIKNCFYVLIFFCERKGPYNKLSNFMFICLIPNILFGGLTWFWNFLLEYFFHFALALVSKRLNTFKKYLFLLYTSDSHLLSRKKIRRYCWWKIQ